MDARTNGLTKLVFVKIGRKQQTFGTLYSVDLLNFSENRMRHFPMQIFGVFSD